MVLRYTPNTPADFKLCRDFFSSVLFVFLLVIRNVSVVPCLVKASVVSRYVEHGTLTPRSQMACM
jgi:hypothetical protein